MITTFTNLDSAITYVKRGWPVFPVFESNGNGGCVCGNLQCSSTAKHPRTRHGVLDATLDEIKVRSWWEQWPQANIGLVTGAASGLVVLDIDPRHGGDKSLDELENQHGQLPVTLECLTGGGGRHLYFSHPGSLVKNKVGLVPGVDLRGDGGYVVAPPSVHISGRIYQWKI